MARTKRTIRLKEIAPNSYSEKTPAPQYMQRTDGSLELKAYVARGDDRGFLRTGNQLVAGPPIVFMGGSFVESMYADEDKRFVSQIERRLHAKGYGYRCLNAGYSGSTTLHSFNVLVNKILPIVREAGTVVFFLPQTDSFIVGTKGSYWNGTKRFATLLPADEPSEQSGWNDLHATRAILRLVVAACKNFGVDLVLAASPFRDAPHGDDPYLANKLRPAERYERVQALRAELAHMPCSVGRESAVPAIDGHALLSGQAQYFYDDLHLNDEGQQMFAESFATELMKHLERRRRPIWSARKRRLKRFVKRMIVRKR